MTALVRKYKKELHILINVDNSPAKGNFCDEHGNAIKPAIVEVCSKHMGDVDILDRMASS
jgi:hypothetical protein